MSGLDQSDVIEGSPKQPIKGRVKGDGGKEMGGDYFGVSFFIFSSRSLELFGACRRGILSLKKRALCSASPLPGSERAVS